MRKIQRRVKEDDVRSGWLSSPFLFLDLGGLSEAGVRRHISSYVHYAGKDQYNTGMPCQCGQVPPQSESCKIHGLHLSPYRYLTTQSQALSSIPSTQYIR
jgi:hypothetical protein